MHARRNVELKARCPDPAAAERAAVSLGAADRGLLRQLDTYFRVPNGRLKLRETDGRPAELIYYHRENTSGDRPSDYQLVPVPDPAALKSALAGALGVRGEVRKVRHLLMWHNVRIHLDTVEGLGAFLEFEAVLSEGEDEPTSYGRLSTLATALNVRDEDRLSHSYSDLHGL